MQDNHVIRADVTTKLPLFSRLPGGEQIYRLVADMSFNEKPDAWILRHYISDHPREFYASFDAKAGTEGWCIKCPYGKPGDHLWVRETFCDNGLGYIRYKADFPEGEGLFPGKKWKPSIHMPRVASRIQLEIMSTRVERVREITEQDAKAEGVEDFEDGYYKWYGKNLEGHVTASVDTAYKSFYSLWRMINGEESWRANPWVWVIEFKRVKP